jgi:phosphoglycolate phosphatase-like HAD superfamily hydrolase
MDGIRPHGKTDPAIVREVFTLRGNSGFSPEIIGQILEAYTEFLSEEVRESPSYRILPGIVRFLEDFHGRHDLALGLATGNIERGARIKLARGDLNRFFAFGGFGSDSESRTELVCRAAKQGARHIGRTVRRDDVFVIGDTPRDIDAGRESGFRTVGVATSDYTIEDLEAAGADFVLSDFERDRDQFLRMARIE